MKNTKEVNVLISGILLLLVSISVLVMYIIRYKKVSFKKKFNDCTKEAFTQPTSVSINDLEFDNTIFDRLLDSSQYVARINEIRNRRIDYENLRRQNLTDQFERDKLKARQMAKDREQRIIDEHKIKMKKVPNIIRSIKSNSNSQILSTLPISTNTYQIKINDKCLTVYDDNKYLLDKCSNSIKMSDSQKFESKRIYDLQSAKYGFGKNVVKRMNYPYNVFMSKVTNQCLTIDNDGATVIDCNPNDSRQHFKISGQENVCPLA